MGKSITEVGVEELVKSGLVINQAKFLETELKAAIEEAKVNSKGDTFNPKKLWHLLTAKKLLKPSYPHSVHQLIYYSVYNNFDVSVNGLPHYWFPSLDEAKCSNLGHLMEKHGRKLLGEAYKDPITSFKLFHKFSVDHPEIYWPLALGELSIQFVQEPKCILDTSDKSKQGGQWLPGSVLNIAECCLMPCTNPKKQDDSLAIVWRDEGCDDFDVNYMTLLELRQQVMLVANALDKMFSKGDAVAIAMPMTTTAVIIYLAIILAGFVVVSIADSFASKEIATRLRISKAKAIFTQPSCGSCSR